MKTTGTQFRFIRLATLLLLSLTLVAGTACGPPVIKGRPPFVSISSMNLDGNMLSTGFDIANQNGVAMSVDQLEISVTVRGSELVRLDSQESLEVDANSTETVSTRFEPDDFTKTLLSSLENGQLESLSIDLEGRAHTLEDGYLRFEQKGFLYTVPGRPGHFRSAFTQAKGLVREEPR